MIWFALTTLALLTVTVTVAVRAKQALIDEARSGTRGYF